MGAFGLSLLKGLLLPLLAVALLFLLVLARRWREPARPDDPSGLRSYASFAGGDALTTAAERERMSRVGAAARGAGLALALERALRERGVRCAPPMTEPYGYVLAVALPAQACEVRVGFVGEDEAEWLVTVDAVRTPWERWLRRPPSPPEPEAALPGLLSTLDAALRALDGVRSVRWHRREQWNAGVMDAGQLSPVA